MRYLHNGVDDAGQAMPDWSFDEAVAFAFVWFSRGGHAVIGNLVLLCRRHHRAVHEGGWSIEGDPASELRFIRPNGRRLDTRPPPLRKDVRDWLREVVPSLGTVPRLAFGPG